MCMSPTFEELHACSTIQHHPAVLHGCSVHPPVTVHVAAAADDMVHALVLTCCAHITCKGHAP